MDEQSIVPSKVLHVRNLPPDVLDRELSILGTPFGQVINVLLLRAKNQAFIELGDSTAASRMVNYYSNMPATIRSKIIIMLYFTFCLLARSLAYVKVESKCFLSIALER